MAMILKLQVEVADETTIEIKGSYPTDGQELIGTGVIVAQRDALGSFRTSNDHRKNRICQASP